MSYHLEIVSDDKHAPLSFGKILEAASGRADLVPGGDSESLIVKRAGGLEAPLYWDEKRATLSTDQPETDVLAVMIGLAAEVGGRVRGERFETYRTPFEFYRHPEDFEAAKEMEGRVAKLHRRRTWKGLLAAFALPACVLLILFGLNCPWFWPKPPVFASGSPEAPVSVVVEGTRARNAEVIFAPLDDFDFRFAVELARKTHELTGLRIRVAVPIDSRPGQPYPNSNQYDAIRIVASLDPEIVRLRADDGNAMIVFFTNRDINQGEALTRFVFAFHDYPQRVTVLSSARLVQGIGFAFANRETIRNRMLKFSLRAVGEHHYALPRSEDVGSVMYAPIRGLPDVDKMGFKLE